MRWGRSAKPRTVNGVKCDAIIEIESDHWIAIEISKEHTLDKLRINLAKFDSIRPYLLSKGIHVQCYFVSEHEPTDMFRQTAKGKHVTALSQEDLVRVFFDFRRYTQAREERSFGSAVDPLSGNKDDTMYIPVNYYSTSRNRIFTIADITDLLLRGRKIILLGEYGTGKSRCHQQLFRKLAFRAMESFVFPLSIDLREMCGCRCGEEIVRRHFDDVGLRDLSEMYLRLYRSRGLCFLLNGFDEISSQMWSDDPNRLQLIRREALSGVSDLIISHSGSLIVSGRAHYFNDDQEMLDALGLDSIDTVIIRCEDSFSEQETVAFLRRIDVNLSDLPLWLPRRPLVLQTFAHLSADERNQIIGNVGAETEFCQSLIDIICKREARIRSILDPYTIRQVLQRIARIVRFKSDYSSAVSVTEVNQAFESVVGTSPIDESAVMLQRLPALGRVSAETNDRRFIDLFLLDGLFGMDVVEIVQSAREEPYKEQWNNPARQVGIAMIAQSACLADDVYVTAMHKAIQKGNNTLGVDILCSLLLVRENPIRFDGISMNGIHIYCLDFSEGEIRNLRFKDCIIENLILPPYNPIGLEIETSDISAVYGVSSQFGLPSWVRDCRVGEYESVSTLSRIKRASLSNSEIMFLSIIKKTFFQPGSGRKEIALVRGIGDATVSKYVKKMLSLLIKDDILSRTRGDEGWVYHAERRHTRRMAEIVAKLSLSRDPLWEKVACLEKEI